MLNAKQARNMTIKNTRIEDNENIQYMLKSVKKAAEKGLSSITIRYDDLEHNYFNEGDMEILTLLGYSIEKTDYEQCRSISW